LNSLLLQVGTSVLNFTVHNNFPFVTGIVKNTLFEQFCGGETREESMKVVKQLFKEELEVFSIILLKEKKTKKRLMQYVKKSKIS
jgi:hypothetical protein